MRILRVFPQKTSYTPDDEMSFVGMPPGMMIPEHDEIHISVTFTWDIPYGNYLKFQWQIYTDKPVKIGGVAYGSPASKFIPGLYVKKGITFTSRGCNNSCEHCAVWQREGKIKELPILPGNIIQDNNFLQTSRKHKEAVFEMLKGQRDICFKGGLQTDLIDSNFIENVKQLKISEIWLACDSDSAITELRKAARLFTDIGFTRDGTKRLKCYVLIGDDMTANERRLQAVYKAGCMPFSQLYQPIQGKRNQYDKTWQKFNRQWMRPPAIIAHMEKGTKFDDYYT